MIHASLTLSASRGLRVAALAALTLGLPACSTLENFNPFSGEKYETKLLPDVPAETIYNQGLGRLQRKDNEGAVKKFADVEKQYPFSQWSKKALLMTAFAQYDGALYDDAIQTSSRFSNLYPNDPDAAYALYLGGMSYYSQIPDISRDQERAEKALQVFTLLVTRFPKSEYVPDAKYKIQVTRDQVAGKEMSVGRFYLNRKNYTAAINRFREVLAKYQTSRHTEEALERLVEAYMGLGITNEAQTAAAILGHNYPDGQWYKDAFSLLQSGGLEPRESKDSWLSKLFSAVIPS